MTLLQFILCIVAPSLYVGKLLDGALPCTLQRVNNYNFRTCHSAEVGIPAKQKQTQAEMNSDLVCRPKKTQEMKGQGRIQENELIESIGIVPPGLASAAVFLSKQQSTSDLLQLSAG